MTTYRVRVKGYNVMLLVYDNGVLCHTYHFVDWSELIRWGII